MGPSISVREYIKWGSQAPSEPTSTVVLTSPGRRYVDIRVLKPQDESTSPLRAAGQAEKDRRDSSAAPDLPQSTHLKYAGIQPLAQLDWAFAGTSRTRVEPAPLPPHTGAHQLHASWEHFVDSRTADGASVVDAAVVFPGGDARTVERGRMVNPASGVEEDYEEAWRDIEPAPASHEADVDADAPVACVVAVLHDDATRQRGQVVRVGRWCQGVVRVADSVSLERWEWSADGGGGGWRRSVRMGDLWLPCGLAMEPADLELGGEIRQGEQVWRVVELVEGD